MVRFAALAVVVVCLACSEPASHGTTAQALRKVDILWVFDHSPGSCRVEQSLARDFHALTDTLAARGVTDVRLAVIADQQIADKDKADYGAITRAGLFQHQVQRKVAPTCHVVRRIPCGLDPNLGALCDAAQKACLDKCGGMAWCAEDCGTPHTACVGAARDATCDGPGEVTLTGSLPSSLCPADGVYRWPPPPAGSKWACTVNPPDSFASHNCWMQAGCGSICSTDQECREAFEADIAPEKRRMVCMSQAMAGISAGCAFPPTTADCPPDDQLPDMLDSANLGLAPCLLQMKLSNNAMSVIEGGLRAAWEALDPQGSNCPRDDAGKVLPTCQNRRLLRDDALLLIVFSGDEDDCSVDLGISLDISTPDKAAALLGNSGTVGLLPGGDRSGCQYLGDADGGDPDMQEGRCRAEKLKNPTVRCRKDCAALPKGSPEMQPCLDAYATFALTDKRFGSVSTFHDKFGSLKANPSQVMFVSIAGDSPLVTHQPGEVPFGAAIHEDRIAAYGSRSEICATDTSKGEFGSRYVKLAQQFGTHGYIINWCADHYGAALSALGERVADVMAGKVK